MKTSIEIIKDLVQWFEEFSRVTSEKELSLESFILWLNSRLFSENHIDKSMYNHETIDMQLSFLLVMQNKYYKSYAKKVLGESELTSPDGFSFLYHLNLVSSYRKMELIKMHHIEPPSGIEILKRLLNKGFIEEFDDPDDKRAKRIRITESGRNEIQHVLPKMNEVFHLMTANMSLEEKLHLMAILKQMDEFHNDRLFKT